jgi:hypothetical protein
VDACVALLVASFVRCGNRSTAVARGCSRCVWCCAGAENRLGGGKKAGGERSAWMPALLDARGRCTSVGRIVVIRPCPDSSSHVFATFQPSHPGLNPLLNFMFYFARTTHKGDASQLLRGVGYALTQQPPCATCAHTRTGGACGSGACSPLPIALARQTIIRHASSARVRNRPFPLPIDTARLCNTAS